MIAPPAQLVDRGVLHERMLLVSTVARWLAQAPVESDTVISVIVPSRNRRPYLARAIDSIFAQRHSAFELIVINDGSTDDTDELLASIADPRLRVLRTSGIGASAARNLGLDAATGALVAHFDDDNLMDPLWLRGVAWPSGAGPTPKPVWRAHQRGYGCQEPDAVGLMPNFRWPPFDRAQLEHTNYIDMSTIAHRAGSRRHASIRRCIRVSSGACCCG